MRRPPIVLPELHRAARRASTPVGAVLASALVAAGLVALLWVPSCRSLPAPRHVVQVSAAASAAFEEARAWARATPLDGSSMDTAVLRPPFGELPGSGSRAPETVDPARARERARAAAERARDLAPDWVAPRRMLDDLAREDLLGLEALEAHRSELRAQPGRADLCYLAGRLEGMRGARRFARAVELDPDLAWGHHGKAWAASIAGRRRAALRSGALALARARSPYERAFFTAALARYHLAGDDAGRALELIEERLEDRELAPIDRIELSVQAALIELSLVYRPEYERGWQRALALLREHDLTEAEIGSLLARMRLFRPYEGSLELQLALAARRSPARDRLRAELLLESRSTPLALGLLRRSRAASASPAASGPLLRSARFAAGQFGLAMEEWLRDVPSRSKTADGLPRDATLARVVASARALGSPAGPDELTEFGDRLLAAGWFLEARSVASALAASDLGGALALEDRAAAGQGLVQSMRRLMLLLDERSRRGGGLATRAAATGIDPEDLAGEEVAGIDGMRDLLGAMAPLVARAQALMGGEIDPERISAELESSPLIAYGPVGALVHPGPRFSAEDERLGRGARGAPVPGLAALFARLGRFAIFGELKGQGGPDGTILQRVLIEERSGEHFGVPWSGTVAVCEGADLRARAGRRGAGIAGAALHEGYWIDFDSLRRDRDAWALVERDFATPAAAGRLSRALASRGLALPEERLPSGELRAERRDIDTLLGQSDRVRLAVLRDRLRARARPTSSLGEGPSATDGLVSLDELVLVTELHEQGHLCDRTRFLPITEHLGAVFKFLVAHGFRPGEIAKALEYRAELTALAHAPDPRVVLVSILSAVESGGNGVTPHAAGYRELLADLVAVLDRDLGAHPERWPELDPGHVLVHQLHRLGPERVRELAHMLARRKGLDRRR